MNWQSHALNLLTASLLRPCALAAAAWLLLRIFGIRHPASRHAAWTAVLAGTLLLPPLTLITPKLTLRVLPAKPLPAATIPAAHPTTSIRATNRAISTETAIKAEQPQAPRRHWPTTQTLIMWLYLAGLLAMLTWRLIAWNVLRGIMSGSNRIHRFLHQSNDVLTPVTCGVLRPSVILPADWRIWPTETRRAALAHEYAHIRRYDTLTLALTRFATCICWFHPLVWWLARRISDLAELSCDAAVLEKTGNATAYSRILLAFAEKVTEAKHRIAMPRMAIATASGMSRRIDRIFELSGGNLRKLSHPGLLLALSGLPLTCLIATVALGSPMTPSHLGLAKQPEPKIVAQSRPAPATNTTQSLTPPPSDIQPRTPLQSLEVLTSFAPTDSEDPHDALVVHGTLPNLLAQSTPALAQRRAPQLAPPVRLEFDAASVKPVKASGGGREGPRAGSALQFQSGRVVSYPEGVTARRLIMDAFGLQPQQILGGPTWLDSDSFYIDAKAADASVGTGQLRQMLQALLIDRFKLAIGRSTRTMPVYALSVAKSGPKLHEIKEGEVIPDNGKELAALGLIPPFRSGEKIAGMTRIDGTLDQFAALLSDYPKLDDRPVLNETGLTGTYLIALTWYADGDITTAIQDMLGLKLEPQKDSVEVVTVDHIERPDPN